MNIRRNFTLIEVLVSCGIIALLAGIGFAGYGYAQNSSRNNATKSLVYQLSTALETCYNKYGFYPAADPGSELKFTFVDGKLTKVEFGDDTTLEKPTTDADKKKTAGKYFALLANTLDLQSILSSSSKEGDVYTLIDSWGGKIYYSYPGKVNTTKFDIVSAGVDGVFGDTGAETPAALEKKNYIDGKDWICDDIANF